MFSLGLGMRPHVSPPKGEILVFSGTLGFLDICPVDFPSWVYWQPIFPVQIPGAGVPSAESQYLAPLGDMPV